MCSNFCMASQYYSHSYIRSIWHHNDFIVLYVVHISWPKRWYCKESFPGIIYILIAGTYTPIALCAIKPVNSTVGWGVFIIEWSLAIVAIIFNAIDLKKYAVFAMICNLVMGWGIIVVIPVAIEALTWNGFMYILAGGIFYTVGAVLYGIGRNKSYMHCIFHVFVLLGSIAHLLGIMFYVL